MPNFTTPIPPKLSGDNQADITAIKRWGTALIDELTYLFNNLDCKNVIEAGMIRAENINTTKAKISNAQIGELTADKLTAGTVDTSKITVKDQNSRLKISGSEISISDGEKERFYAAYDKTADKFCFVLCNNEGKPTVSIDGNGDACFGGTIEGACVYSSSLIGTSSVNYQNTTGDVFAKVDPKGIKIMQDKNGTRKQKIGMSASNDGTVYLVLGAGDGSGKVQINDVEYTNGSFTIEKNDVFTTMGIIGNKPFVTFYENGKLSLAGDTVLINNTDIMGEISSLKQRISRLETTANG